MSGATIPVHLPVIRTAMRMSRATIKVKPSDKLEILEKLKADRKLTMLEEMHNGKTWDAGFERPSGRKMTRARFESLRGRFDQTLLPIPPFLSPQPKSKTSRSCHWSSQKAKYADQFYANWEADECMLEMTDVVSPATAQSLLSGNATNSPASNPEIEHIPDFSKSLGEQSWVRKKATLFRPRALNASKSSHNLTMQNRSGPIETMAAIVPKTGERKFRGSEGVQKRIKKAAQVLKEAAGLPKQHSVILFKPQEESTRVMPVVRLTKIESDELDNSSSDNEVEEALAHLRETRAPKQTLQPISQSKAESSSPSQRTYRSDYSQQTAEVLASTSSIARRRSERMLVPERLFRHARMDGRV